MTRFDALGVTEFCLFASNYDFVMQVLMDNVEQKALLSKASVDAVVYKAMADNAEARRPEKKSRYDVLKAQCDKV
jgi:hypothetical protein